jgi:hypothetical protein
MAAHAGRRGQVMQDGPTDSNAHLRNFDALSKWRLCVLQCYLGEWVMIACTSCCRRSLCTEHNSRLARGDGAKRRGTGSFHIPHRLNADERPVYEAAKKRVSVAGSVTMPWSPCHDGADHGGTCLWSKHPCDTLPGLPTIAAKSGAENTQVGDITGSLSRAAHSP